MSDEQCPTLGEISDIFRALKEKGVHRGSALWCIDNVWWEDQQRLEAGR